MTGPEGPLSLSPTQLAFLTLVFAEGRVSRPRVARILWRSGDTPKVRHRMRQLLHLTNARVGFPAVTAENDSLRAADLPCDLVDLRSALARGCLLEAAKLLAKGFAPIPLPRVGGEYEDWVTSSQRTLRRDLLTKSRSAWHEACEASDWQRARDAAEAEYLLEPTNAEAVERVIDARARNGRIGSAEAAYGEYVDTLPHGERPCQGIEAVIERARAIRRRRPEVERNEPGPFVGRTQGIAAGVEAVDRVSQGEFTFLLVTGEGGIGKTRLLEEIRRDAVLRGLRCLDSSPVELERRIFLNPVLDALREVDLRPHLERLGAPWSTVISTVLPPGHYDEMAGELPPIQESSLPRRLLDAFSMLLASLARETPTLLFIDDLHWADATTIEALQFLQRRYADIPFGVIASLRPDALADEGPAVRFLEDGGEISVSRVHLEDLSREDALRLIDGLARGSLEPTTRERLCDLAGPHPLYLTELTRDYLAGRLTLPEIPDGQMTVPVSLKQILSSRIARLSEPAERIAGILAAGSRRLRLPVIAALAGLELDECVDRLDELEECRLADVERDAVRISHDLFRTVIYQRLSEARRAFLHGAIAERLLDSDTEVPDSELAVHFHRAGRRRIAADHGWAAAEVAWESGAMAEAAYFYGLVTEDEDDPLRIAEATAGQACALHLMRDIGRALPVLELAAQRLRSVGMHEEARRIEIRRVDAMTDTPGSSVPKLLESLSNVRLEAEEMVDWEAVALSYNTELRLLHRVGEPHQFKVLFDDVRRSESEWSNEASVLFNAVLAIEALFDEPEEGRRRAQLAVTGAANGSPHRLMALTRLLVVLQCQGEMFFPETQAALREARLLAKASGDLRLRFSVEANFALALLDAGELDAAEAALANSTRLLGSADLDLGRSYQSVNQAELAIARGDFAQARALFEAAQKEISGHNPNHARSTVSAGIGLCALEMGDLAEARRQEQSLRAPTPPWHFDPTIILAFRSRLLEVRGQRGVAIDLLDTAATHLRRTHVVAWMKVREIQIRLMVKDRRPGAADYAEECAAVASALKLQDKEAAFGRLRRRATD